MNQKKQKFNINATEARQYFGKVIQRVNSRKAALQNLSELNRTLNRKANEMGLTEEKLTKKVEETKKEIFEELYG